MILDLFKLDGRIAIVTGASRGLGQSIAVGLAEAGADVAGVSALSPTSLAKVMTLLPRPT